MDIKTFKSAIAQIAEEKSITSERVIESIETAIAAAYKKDYGKKGQIIKAKLNPETGETKFWQVKLVVVEDMIYSEKELEELIEKQEKEEKEEKKIRFNPEKHIMLAEAQKIKPEIKAREELEMPLETHEDYGRIAAQTAKQVILQKIKEVERETVFSEYKSREGQLVSGIIQRLEGRNVFVDIGKTLGILPKEEQVYGEFYKPGQRLKFYIMKVEESSKGPAVFLSRVYPKLISRLFELEVPEISQGQVVIKAIAREAGFRSKIALESKAEGVDPIGSAVGQRGSRVMAVIKELAGEKIDIIEYSEKPEEFIANALSPAKVLEVKIMPKNKALCLVPEDQLSLAIGKDGQNVRLAAKLTGWKIDVRPPEQEEAEKEEKKKEPEKKKPSFVKTTEGKEEKKKKKKTKK
ncbi:MAG: transcription termination/antitermination protein NusA [Candidatus Nealsonbacteria bacterium CG10_big_fil_rev_8_21_14_0_10_36_24]|uniref:Transcription termination/antitermination protein NusA n=2 Tax=Candidatus Nealsoniibacteriota TaxID=1817911 RepID=A0A2H0YQA6_9BACT|nr:MAG: transcription termination/antitermination protein NusA [Candidatus Nealsonbacteria bacterium CG10_big_fil_rev_8_21_14_0_10_36_24]PIS39943.1 MAG: transcription termination/antitermination protein NusA [Candidatus Nealsonbacteria bacterium CG08_land_8_20_14_0_20_36_22]